MIRRTLRNRLKSIAHAIRGIGFSLRSEPNLRIHAVATVTVTFFGFYFQIAPWAWVAQCLAIGLVWSFELMNSVWESFLDFVYPDHSPQLGRLKDMAAAAVLVSAMMAAVVGAIIYAPHIRDLMNTLM